MSNSYGLQSAVPAASLGVEARSAFIVRTYHHLFGAIIAFTTIEVALFTTGIAEQLVRAMGSINWLWILGAFLVASWLASRAAFTATSMPAQYSALAAFVVAEALIFVPMLYYAQRRADGVLQSAALVTLLGFTGLTVVAWTTRKDFSFLSGILRWAMILALVAIIGGAIFGFQLGTFFSVAMLGVAGAAILYDTSNVLHHFPEDRHVGAALQLFASVALMFWYVLRLFISRD